MFYQEFRPALSLRPYIRAYAYLAHQPGQAGDQSIQDLFPPTLTKQIIVQLTSSSAISATNGIFSGPGPESYLSPHISRSFRLTSTQLFELFAVVFLPGAFHAIYPFPLKELEDHIIPLEDLQEFSLPEFGQQIREARSFPERVAVADAYFMGLLRKRDPVATRSRIVVRRMLQGPERPLSQLMGDSGLSERQVRRLFVREMGTSPKTFQKNARILKALHLLTQAPHLDLAEISYLCGYYDPSHFSLEFRRIMLLTPSAYRQQQYELAQAVIYQAGELEPTVKH